MSTSTSGVPRPPANRITAKKATAAAGPAPEDGEDALESGGATDKAPASKAAKATAATDRGGPGTKAGGKTTPAGKATTARAGARPAGKGPVKAAAGGKGRGPKGPVRVAQTRNWGPIIMFVGAGVVAVLIIGFGAYTLLSQPDPTKWKERADAIPGIVNFYKTHPDWVKSQDHKPGVLTYPMSPPAGGAHNPRWQNCMGDVYPSEIAKEHATHSMEHGAVWVTYKPGLPKDQVDKLASKVNGRSFMLMSPYPGLDANISLQAWGYQLKVDNADDSRIDDFITDLRQNATKEPQAGCSGGITDMGPTPVDLPASGQ